MAIFVLAQDAADRAPPLDDSAVTTEIDLQSRSGNQCELCTGTSELAPYSVGPELQGRGNGAALLCATCRAQVDGPSALDPEHWRKLTETMWSQEPAVQVLAWRLLRRLRSEAWAAEALEMLYLDEAVQVWAEAGAVGGIANAPGDAVVHRDSNGAVLVAGDAVTLIKDLKVKGAGFTAKRGTAVRNISLVHDNAGHIEGRVSGQQIVILTEFVKKSG